MGYIKIIKISFLVYVLIFIGCQNCNSVKENDCFQIYFSSKYAPYNECLLGKHTQLFFDGAVGEVYEIIIDSNEHRKIYNILMYEKRNNDHVKKALLTYLSWKNDEVELIADIDQYSEPEKCRPHTSEYKKAALRRMLNYQKSMKE